MAAENAHDVAPYDGPALVYGLWGDDCFALVEQEWAEGAAAEIEAIRSAPTWGAAYAAGEAATYIHSTIEEDLAGHDPNDPLDPNEIPGAADGDWPPMLPIYTAEYLPKDWGVGDYYGTVLMATASSSPFQRKPNWSKWPSGLEQFSPVTMLWWVDSPLAISAWPFWIANTTTTTPQRVASLGVKCRPWWANRASSFPTRAYSSLINSIVVGSAIG